MRDLAPRSVFDQFVSSNDELLDVLGGLDEEGWASIAEAPPGHLPVRLIASHALWDSWIHERDVVLALDVAQQTHADEVSASLRYVCALTSALVILSGQVTAGSFGVQARDPEMCFTLHIADSVDIREDAPPASSPTLRGDAVALVEALSTRIPFPTEPPTGWMPLIQGLATAFTARP